MCELLEEAMKATSKALTRIPVMRMASFKAQARAMETYHMVVIYKAFALKCMEFWPSAYHGVIVRCFLRVVRVHTIAEELHLQILNFCPESRGMAECMITITVRPILRVWFGENFPKLPIQFQH